MKQTVFRIENQIEIAPKVFKMTLMGDTSEINNPGEFVDILVPGKFLRRPISVCDVDSGVLTLIYKIVGAGTEILAGMNECAELDILTGLGNGYDLNDERIGDNPWVIGGGVGVPPMYLLAKRLIAMGKMPKVVLGFNTKEEVFLEEEFKALGCDVCVTTVDGTYGVKGFVTDVIDDAYYFACGPEPMLRAIYKKVNADGQMSFETRMGCGFGACMGCSVETKNGYKRLCKEGPVLKKEEVKPWED